MSSTKTTIAIVEDDSDLRATIRELLEDNGCTVTAAYSNGEDALTGLEGAMPDVILMDIQLPGMSGIDLTGKIRAFNSEVGILILTVYDNADRVFNAIAAGASGFLLKRDIPHRLVESIDDVLTGSTPVSSAVARKVFVHFQKEIPNPASEPDWHLTAREEEILDGLVKGALYKEIADQLSISLDTVRFHLRNIYRKLHVRTRTEAVVKYLGKD